MSARKPMLPPTHNQAPPTPPTPSSPSTDYEILTVANDNDGNTDTGFIEDIYDTSLSYPEADLHEKTRELEELLQGIQRGVSVLERPRENHLMPDYVNCDPSSNNLSHSPQRGGDEYIEMSSSFKDKIKFTGLDDLYI